MFLKIKREVKKKKKEIEENNRGLGETRLRQKSRMNNFTVRSTIPREIEASPEYTLNTAI